MRQSYAYLALLIFVVLLFHLLIQHHSDIQNLTDAAVRGRSRGVIVIPILAIFLERRREIGKWGPELRRENPEATHNKAFGFSASLLERGLCPTELRAYGNCFDSKPFLTFVSSSWFSLCQNPF